jgi:hypothetical protein
MANAAIKNAANPAARACYVFNREKAIDANSVIKGKK